MKAISAILNFFLFWQKISRKYDKIRKDEEKRTKSQKMGITSIFYSVICAGLAVLSIFGAISSYGFMQDGSFIIGVVLFIVCLAFALSLVIQGLISGLLYFIYQLKLNKRPIGWVAMAIWIICVIALIVAVILLCGTIS